MCMSCTYGRPGGWPPCFFLCYSIKLKILPSFYSDLLPHNSLPLWRFLKFESNTMNHQLPTYPCLKDQATYLSKQSSTELNQLKLILQQRTKLAETYFAAIHNPLVWILLGSLSYNQINLFSIQNGYIIYTRCHILWYPNWYWTNWRCWSHISLHPLWYIFDLHPLHLLRDGRLKQWSFIKCDIPAQHDLLISGVL